MAHVGLVYRDPCRYKVKGFYTISSIKKNVSKMRHLQEIRHKDSSLWGVLASISEIVEVVVKAKLSLFCHVVVEASEIVSRFIWYKANDYCYSIVGFLTKQYLSISESHIEMEKIFSIVGVLTSLWAIMVWQ